jgi:hypothetical protein
MMWRLAIGIACALTLAGCSGSGSSQSQPATRPSSIDGSTTPSTEPGVAEIDTCRLMTTGDASLLLGHAVEHGASGDAKGGTCKFAASDDPSTTAEIEAKVDFSPASAQAEYPTWVQSIVNAPGFETVPLPGFADEATVVHSSAFDAILFRHDTVLVRIGVSPHASDDALRVVATTVLGRLAQQGHSG